ncbi:capsular polysaccharide biosynthesis protein [Corynebacterium mustelae]|uniref:Capsular polysaccharide biosynthesis protein n=1 Tax=Corynebacterium mustelae TaxID=571915 RepID=A0A0G3H149_9CORY|nr:hypothetical protein [Corynebacterium mustelae]AKK04817.1 capsular polysaccharide biosynthesis protein [Corynebacterium mustelae]
MNQEHGSIGFAALLRIVLKRGLWVLVGTVVGLVIAVGYLLVVPTTYTGTAEVNITAVSSEPVTEGRSASSLVDLSTERQLAASSSTAQLAAAYLGDGWTSEMLMEGISVTGDPDGTVLRVAYTDTDQQRAVEGADQLARAYLDVRSSLVIDRIESVVKSIDRQIKESELELERLLQAQDGYNTSVTVRIDTVRLAIQALQQRRTTWNDVSVESGQVITPAKENVVDTNPSKSKILALGLLSGMFLGIVLALVRHVAARRPLEPEDLEELLDAPVWRPIASVGDKTRWDLAAELLRYAKNDDDSLAIIVDWSASDAMAAAAALSQSTVATMIDVNNNRAQVLRELVGVQSAVLVVPLNWHKVDLQQFVTDIEAINVSLIGIIVVDAKKGIKA